MSPIKYGTYFTHIRMCIVHIQYLHTYIQLSLSREIDQLSVISLQKVSSKEIGNSVRTWSSDIIPIVIDRHRTFFWWGNTCFAYVFIVTYFFCNNQRCAVLFIDLSKYLK